MSKNPSPKADQLRAQREERIAEQAAHRKALFPSLARKKPAKPAKRKRK